MNAATGRLDVALLAAGWMGSAVKVGRAAGGQGAADSAAVMAATAAAAAATKPCLLCCWSSRLQLLSRLCLSASALVVAAKKLGDGPAVELGGTLYIPTVLPCCPCDTTRLERRLIFV